MSALDVCEPQIIRALQKQGWRINEKPHMIRTNERFVFADFSLQRRLNGRQEQIIIFEVKCFTRPQMDLQEFYGAVGQYRYYLNALALNKVSYPLYLAIPTIAYERLIKDVAVQTTLENTGIKIVIVDIETEEIIRWIN